ncbi:Uncharacterised protein [Mycobacteroides abscessus subsp. abscessus]|nr:Uncharacterised protein [Mycobacteroides abscessus subsp. abscessus]
MAAAISVGDGLLGTCSTRSGLTGSWSLCSDAYCAQAALMSLIFRTPRRSSTVLKSPASAGKSRTMSSLSRPDSWIRTESTVIVRR